ncbi:MAG: CHAD domain-containing protein [Bacteroidota bacterium]
MLKKQILEYFQNHYKQFEINFKPAITTTNEKAIHDMRVSIKRLSLLYRFLDFCSDNQFCAKKKARLIDKVFKSAGPLRDVQIQLSILDNLKEEIGTAYYNLNEVLKSKEKLGIRDFKKKSNSFVAHEINHLFNFSEAVLKIIIDFPALPLAFDNYDDNRRQKIRCLLKSNEQNINFHKVRKKVKDITYLAEIQQIYEDKPNDELMLLKLLGRKLGDWHDIEVFLKGLATIKPDNQIMVADFKIIEKILKQKQQEIIDEFYKEYETSMLNF